MAIIDNPGAGGGGGGSVDETSALKYMLEHKNNYTGIAAGLTSLTTLPNFTQPSGIVVFYGAFEGCTNLTDASKIDFANIGSASTTFDRMFYGCSNLTTYPANMGSWAPTYSTNTSSSMFEGCSSLTTFPNLTYNKFANLSRMFYGCSGITGSATISGQLTPWTDASYMFYGCSGLTSITFSYNSNAANMTTWDSCFRLCSNLQTLSVPTVAATRAVTASYLFYGCKKLGNLTSAKLNYFFGGGVTGSADYMFNNCSTMTSIPLTSSQFTDVISYQYTFRGCSNLISSPLTSSMTANSRSFSNCFNGCSSMTTFSTINMASCTTYFTIQNMFAGCSSLTSASLDNILASLLTYGYTGSSNKTLKYIGLTSAQATTCTGLSNWSALSAAGWTTGY